MDSKLIAIPGSKSYTNRALIMAALTKGPVTLINPLFCEDTETMISALQTLGLRIETEPDKIIVYDDISVIQDGHYEINARDSGTTLRFLLALLCITPGTKVLQRNPRLKARPIRDLIKALRELGARIDEPTLTIHSSSLKGDAWIDPSLSSQFVSALLMVAPVLSCGTHIRLRGEPASKPYITMTIEMMREWGTDVWPIERGYYIPVRQYQKKEYVIEGDYSSAGYFFAIAALTQSTYTLKNLNPETLQADRRFLTILENMGNVVHKSPDGIIIEGKQLVASRLDMEKCPDQVQTMAVLAAFTEGVTTIRGINTLRLKETERVHALKTELAKMGIRSEDTDDVLTIYGGDPKPAVIDTHGDHRMAMSFAVAKAKLPEIVINNPEVVCKSFPEFWDRFQ